MQERLRRMREERAAGDRGFTLIEVLAVVVIIGILVAIAVPMYMNYRKGAANKSVQSDVRGAVTAIEQFYTENGNAYPATRVGTKSTNLDFPAIGTGTAQSATVSTGNTLSYAQDSSGTSYIVCGINEDAGTVYEYNSKLGGSVKKSAATSLTACISAFTGSGS